ncbi:neutral/alkaline non-lysosomal ceramidase N-terminal domain-containing protein [Paenibacillus sp. HJGM_3]|uniref:neutral/alkaline non-lysosomal ceramidase N-terminal domain-containing protein n=1 Tax=Paenibacillus sp. HJGM_3 TaxID=3379816 RepID=UPI003863E782
MEFLLGTNKIDITPDPPVPLAGYSSRQGVFEGVHHPIYAKVLLFRQWDEEKGKARNRLLVAADLIWWGTELTEKLRRELALRWGMGAEDIVLSASHSHSGPQTSLLMPSLGAADETYLQEVERKLLAGVEQAEANLEPVVIQRGSGTCDIGINRRKLADGKIVGSPNEQGPADPEVTVIRFVNRTGEAKALIVHYTCHPTTTSDNFVSSEFCGIAMERLEQEADNRCVALFLQGCCGDVRPSLHRDGKFYSGHDEDVRRLGARFYESAREVLVRPMQTLQPCSPGGAHIKLPLSFASVPSLEELAEYSQSADAGVHEWAKLLLDHPELVRPAAEFDMVRMDLSEGLSLLAMNAEMVVEYGLFVKEMSGRGVLPVAYCNGMIGYVSTARQLGEGGYEPVGSCKYFGLCSPFTEAAEPAIREKLAALIRI